MVAIPLDKIDYNKVSKYANDLILKEFYPKTKNVSYYLKSCKGLVSHTNDTDGLQEGDAEKIIKEHNLSTLS